MTQFALLWLFRSPEPETAIQLGIRFLERLCNPVSIVSDATSLSSQTYPEAETTRIYFRGSEVVCLSSEDKTCQAIRSDPAKQEGILRGASDLLRQLSAIKPESEVPDVDFVKYL